MSHHLNSISLCAVIVKLMNPIVLIFLQPYTHIFQWYLKEEQTSYKMKDEEIMETDLIKLKDVVKETICESSV